MKDRKLLIPVRSTTRKFYLHPPPAGRNDWHVRFTPPAINGSRRVVFRSTGTKEIAAAKRIAAQIIESFWNDAGRGSEAPSRASPVCESGEHWQATSGRGLLRAGVQLLLNKAGEILKPLKGRGGKLTWTGVDQA